MKRKYWLTVLFFLCALLLCAQPAAAAKKKTGWVTENGARYYYLENGEMAKKRWIKVDGSRYYLTESGKAAKGWRTMHGRTYYFFKRDGKAFTGLHTIHGSKYYFSFKGVMAVSKWKTVEGKTYYFKKDGKMATGWLKLGGKKYYLGTDGARVTGIKWIDGKGYYFDENGVYQKDKKVTVDPTKPMVAITYDDGPGPYTERLLDYLEQNNAVATFFLVGQNIPRYKDTVKRAYQLGCEIGNHTWNHSYLSRLSAGGIQSQISQTNAQIRALTGQSTILVRPPYGAYNSSVLSNIGAPAITWSIDTRDWEHRNSARTISNVMSKVRDGDIILMHDIHKSTVDAAATLIPKLKSAGYQLVTVSQLAEYKNKSLVSGQAYSSIR